MNEDFEIMTVSFSDITDNQFAEQLKETENEKNINDNVSVGVETLKEFPSKRQTFHHLSEQEDACKYNQHNPRYLGYFVFKSVVNVG